MQDKHRLDNLENQETKIRRLPRLNGEHWKQQELTAEEAAGMICAKCELRESSEKKARCARWQERWRPRLYLNYVVFISRPGRFCHRKQHWNCRHS
jgi:hypothetical protein